MPARFLALLVVLLTAPASWSAVADHLPPGGANAPEPTAAPAYIIELASLPLGDGQVQVPTGSYTAPASGSPAYGVPGPIAAFQIAGDSDWRGYGYIESVLSLQSFKGSHEKTDAGWKATLTYSYENDASYVVHLECTGKALLLEETSSLGPLSTFVFDAYYNWQPTSGFTTDLTATKQNFLYLPCHYDKPEVTVQQPLLIKEETKATAAASIGVAGPRKQPIVAGFWTRDLSSWKNGDRMNLQLWQRRQVGGDPASRHVLGPETKSDGTPNPHTAKMIGNSLYEGHVTMELALGKGSRKLGFTFYPAPGAAIDLPKTFKELANANR